MAKNKATETEATEAAEPKVDKRHIFVTHPTTGEQVKRVDYIRECAQSGMSRSAITKHIQEITGDENFRYQIVFQATKDMDLPTLNQPRKAKSEESAEAGASAEG